MSGDARHRGGTPVGYIMELPPLEAGAVLFLRLWGDGPEGQARARASLWDALGPVAGGHALEALEALCDICARHARRPLMHHGVTCRCLGADESCFATFIGYASEGQREDAMLIAATLIRPDLAPVTVALAQSFGLALRRMSVKESPPASVTLH